MKVLVADKCGFCFGVEHAIDLAQNLLSDNQNVFCLGPLIHNQQVVDRLVERGLTLVNHLDEIPKSNETDKVSHDQKPTVLIRSHGARPEVQKEVKARGFELADATCVLVKRAQKLVEQLYQQGYQVVVVGDPDHPETKGVIGYAPEVTVIAAEDDIEKLPTAGRLAIIAQTTLSAQDFRRLVGLIAVRGFDELKVVNTICRETQRRQKSALELCEKVDVMFVLGARHSANTRELAQLCHRKKAQTYHLQNFQEFKPRYIEGKIIAGVTAGASTPDWIIHEFVENLQKL